ncbi:MAG: hypothetical protein CL709_10825 [Chloroflexi bacterium]|nr:hypothetical protein [Chloroflexota bacterium]
MVVTITIARVKQKVNTMSREDSVARALGVVIPRAIIAINATTSTRMRTALALFLSAIYPLILPPAIL